MAEPTLSPVVAPAIPVAILDDQPTFHFENRRIAAVLENADARALLAAVGLRPPTIPSGSNTAFFAFTTATGQRAVAFNQAGHEPVMRHGYAETDGCGALVLLDTIGSEEEDDALLLRCVERLLG